jgi:crossover junction endodeoxyribonuclease RuvC
MRILGVDPGSRLTGYGCVDLVGNQVRLVAHGTLRLSNTGGRAYVPLEQRLLLIHRGLSELIELHRPQILVVEKVFFAKNAVSALKLGQARGAVILSGAIHGLPIAEYSPSEVKAAIVGHGGADKEQVAKMVQLLVGAQKFVTADASDGLAIAICHAHRLGAASRTIAADARGGGARSLSARDLQGAPTTGAARDRLAARAQALNEAHQALGKRSKKGLSLAESLGISSETGAPRRKPRALR